MKVLGLYFLGPVPLAVTFVVGVVVMWKLSGGDG